MEGSRVRWGRRTIEYGIRRSPRRQTVAVSVDATEGVVLTAPSDVPVERLDGVVRNRAEWIVNKLRHLGEQAEARMAREWISGETVAYLGRSYRLKVQRRARPRGARLERGRLVVEIARGESHEEASGAVRESVVSWYRSHAENRLEERVRLWAPRIGVDVPPLVVPKKAATKRWASCTRSGVVRASWRIIQAPMALVDYVVAHELVHLVHRDHTEAFWARLEDAMPDFEARREALRRLGPELEW